MPTEQYANAFWTHLTAPAAAEDLTIHVASAAPATLQGGQSRFVCGSEIMLATAGQSTTTWTVTRAVEGTAAASHRSGTPVAHVLTAGSLLESDVRAYGPVGTADDTAVLQAAIDASIAAEMPLLLPAGHYTASNLVIDYGAIATVTRGYRGLVVRGQAGRNTIIEQVAGATGSLLTVRGKTGAGILRGHDNKVLGFTLERVSLVGNGVAGNGLELQSTCHSVVRDVEIRGFGDDGIVLVRDRFSATDDEYLYALDFDNVFCWLNGGYGLHAESKKAVGGNFRSCQFEGNALGGVKGAFTTSVFDACFFGGNGGPGLWIVQCSRYIVTSPEYTGEISSTVWNDTIIGCRFEANCSPTVRGEAVPDEEKAEIRIDAGYGHAIYSCDALAQQVGVHCLMVGTDTTGTGDERVVRNLIVEGGFWQGDNVTAGQKFLKIGSHANQVTARNPRLDYANFADGAAFDTLALVDDAGSQTYIQDNGYQHRSGDLWRMTGALDKAFAVQLFTNTYARCHILGNGSIGWGDGSAVPDTSLYRFSIGKLKTDGKFIAATGLGVGNSAAATTPGSVVKKMEVFDASGLSLGFVAIYDAIT